MSANCDVTVIFPIYGQFGVILKPDPQMQSVKLTSSLIVTFYLTKTGNKTKKS